LEPDLSLYIAGKTYARHNGNQVPDDIQVESLNNYQMAKLFIVPKSAMWLRLKLLGLI